jgi:predicted AlkP superfamily pyrophosphatase or phosphodiesterase
MIVGRSPFMRRERLFCIALLAIAAAAIVGAQAAGRPILVLVSFDGWRADYGSPAATPNLTALAARGVRAEALIPAFPPKTFPNHYTIVTGLYPEHHGIVSNVMDDRTIGERFTMSSDPALDPRWWGGEPVWNTAGRQGLRSAAMFWPGSEVAIGGRRPTYWLPYSDGMANAARVKQVLDWLALPAETQPQFITIYFNAVDEAGHKYGPESPQTKQAVRTLDAQLGSLVSGVARLGLTDRVTVAVVSDHGMAQLDPAKVVFVDDYLDLSKVETVVEWSPLLAMHPRAGAEDAVYRALKDRNPHLRVYRRDEMPAAFHYRDNPRIAPILGLADEGWTITTHDRFAREQARGDGDKGTHGFDPSAPSMRALFVAAGPRLRHGITVPAFENVHLYDFFCEVLGLTPAPNDGDPAVTRGFFAR